MIQLYLTMRKKLYKEKKKKKSHLTWISISRDKLLIILYIFTNIYLLKNHQSKENK